MEQLKQIEDEREDRRKKKDKMIKEYEEKKASELKLAQEQAEKIREQSVPGETEVTDTSDETAIENETTQEICDNR